MNSGTRTYRQTTRARATRQTTERVLQAAHDLFLRLPFDQVTFNAVATEAGVGVQTVIRRFGTKDGLARAVGDWVAPQVAANLGEPVSGDPAQVAGAFARHYERWALLTERTLHQQDASPVLAEQAEGGRRAHRAWVAAAFAPRLGALGPDARRQTLARLVAVTGVELWLVLRRDEGLEHDEACAALTDLMRAVLPPAP